MPRKGSQCTTVSGYSGKVGKKGRCYALSKGSSCTTKNGFSGVVNKNRKCQGKRPKLSSTARTGWSKTALVKWFVRNGKKVTPGTKKRVLLARYRRAVKKAGVDYGGYWDYSSPVF